MHIREGQLFNANILVQGSKAANVQR